VGDAAAETGPLGERLVQVDAVDVAGGVGERRHVVLAQALSEVDAGADTQAVLDALLVELPLLVVIGRVRAAGGPREAGQRVAPPAHLRQVVREVGRRDDTDECAVLDDRQVAHVVFGGQFGRPLDRVVRRDGDQVDAHDVGDEGPAVVLLRGEDGHGVGLGDDADRLAVRTDDERAGLLGREPFGDRHDRRVRLDGVDVLGHHVADVQGDEHTQRRGRSAVTPPTPTRGDMSLAPVHRGVSSDADGSARGRVGALVRRLEPPPRLVDWSLFALVVLVLATGLVSLVSGAAGRAWVFVTHGLAGLALSAFLFLKLRRVRHRVTGRAWTVTTLLSVLLATVTLGALASGVWWVFGGALDLGPWGLLNLHIGLGLAVVPLLLSHLSQRFRPPARSDLQGRRTALQYGTVLVGAAAAWRAQQSANRLLDTAGADRRFTGSREEGSGEGNAFPVTSWVADDPDPIAAEAWTLSVEGAVETPLSLSYTDVDPTHEDRVLLDCTSGWYSEHDWRGLSVGDLLDRAGASDDAGWVQFRSVTGYRWSLPVEEAREATLATHVDGERLSHGHGFPLRLVAPERRGFQWVKWVEGVRVTRRRDRSEWVAVFVSGLDE
jgi:DMSO/TMAO reductase YedYZ molybdopterin-dependent catalytic subunit